jgi:hypothetical protein
VRISPTGIEVTMRDGGIYRLSGDLDGDGVTVGGMTVKATYYPNGRLQAAAVMTPDGSQGLYIKYDPNGKVIDRRPVGFSNTASAEPRPGRQSAAGSPHVYRTGLPPNTDLHGNGVSSLINLARDFRQMALLPETTLSEGDWPRPGTPPTVAYRGGLRKPFTEV